MIPPKTRTDLRGRRFGSLVILDFAGVDRHRQSRWKLRCDCGRVYTTSQSNLVRASNPARYCTCCRRITHGFSRSRIYRIWRAMKTRCLNKSHNKWKFYGGRGITICTQWISSFETFLRDMGTTYRSDLTLDRIDGTKNYEPRNCRWATWKTQRANRAKWTEVGLPVCVCGGKFEREEKI